LYPFSEQLILKGETMANTPEITDIQTKSVSNFNTADYMRLAAQKSGKSAGKLRWSS